MQPPGAKRGQHLTGARTCAIEALEKQTLRFGRRHLEGQRTKWPNLRQRFVVAQRPQRKGIFVHVARLVQQRLDEITGLHVVDQIREEMAAERVVPMS
jgi:hypothetical protein